MKVKLAGEVKRLDIDGLLGRRERYRASGAAAAKPGTLLLLPLLLAGMAGVYLLSPPESYARPQLVDSLRSLVEEGLGSLTPGKEGDVVVTSRHPLELLGEVRAVLLGGRRII